MTHQKARTMANKWVLMVTLSAILSIPAIAAVADEPSPNASAIGKEQSSKTNPSNSPLPYVDADGTRESLESKYEDPGDVSLSPKLVFPRSNKIGKSKFDVVQLLHQRDSSNVGQKPDSMRLQVKSQPAIINSIPVDIENAVISFKTPAQEFFDGASNGLLVLGSSALAMGGFIIFRTKRKDHHHN
jgi:hypothetical protein